MARTPERSGSLSVSELERGLREGRIAPVYLVVGEEGYLRRRVLELLRERIVGPGEDEATVVERHDGDEAELDEILDSARSPSLFAAPGPGTSRLVLVLGFDPSGIEDTAPLKRYLSDPVPDTCLVFVVEKLDRRYGAAKLLEEGATLVRCDPSTRPRKVRRWIRNVVGEAGRDIDDAAVDYLLETVAREPDGKEPSYRLDPVARELEKAVVYVAEGDSIGVRDLERLLGRSREHSVFELTDHLVRGDSDGAIRMLNRLLDEGQQPFAVLGPVAWIVRQLLIAADVADKGMPRKRALREIGGLWNARPAILERGSGCDRRRLEEILASCSDADLKVKMMGGGPGARGVLEDLCRQICRADD